jgi:uncharacterized membrane protein YfcA
MDFSQALLCTLAGWAIGGFANGIAGFGAAMVAMPIVTSGMDMRQAVPTCGLMVLALNVQMAWSYREHLTPSGLGPLILGCLPGAALGVLLLRHCPEAWLKGGLGLLLVAYALWGLLAARPRPRRLAAGWAALTGVLSASLGTAFGFNGPPLAVYLSLRGGTQSQIKAALGAFFIASSFCIVAGHALTGLHSPRTLTLAAAALPAAAMGGWLGIRASGRFRENSFRRILFLMIFAMGLTMLFGSMTP